MNTIENIAMEKDEKDVNCTSKFIVTRDELKEDIPTCQASTCNEKPVDKKEVTQVLLEVVFNLLNKKEA